MIPNDLVCMSRDHYNRLLEIEQTLMRISSASPKMDNPGTPEQRNCCLCHAMIDEARDTLGYERYPAIPHTKKTGV